MKVYTIIIIVVAFILLTNILFNKETFNVSFYNDSDVSNNQDTLYEKEVKQLNEMFEQANPETFPDYRTTYNKLPGYIRFPWQKLVKDLVTSKLLEVFLQNPTYRGSKILVVKDMYNIYWYDDKSNNRHLIFTVDVRNDTLKWTRKIKFYAVLNNLSDFVTDTGDYITELNDDFQKQFLDNLSIRTISLEESTVTLAVKGMDDKIGNEDFHNYYMITNTLHLMDPYLTSGKKMVITDEMRENFEFELKERQRREKERSLAGFCYNTTNLTANTKQECIDSGGIWDYPPETSYECPYYSANENYPNSFGNLVGDKCQLPKNMQIIGHRNYSLDPKLSPLCYNCNKDTSIMYGVGTLGFCCDDQNDKTKYPQLITPDYAFDGDQEIRNKYFDDLRLKGLNVK
mgnify:FL=1|jgi:hypothetical protein